MQGIPVVELDEQGRMRRLDTYDLEQPDRALARFAGLAAPAASSQPFANTASATVELVIDSLTAHDWQRFERLFAEDFHMSDRRRVVQLELDRSQYVAFTREVADGRTARGESKVIATRGERLALTHSTFVFADADVGPSEIAFLIIQEVDERGRIIVYARFDVDDLDAAYAELDRLWEAGEGAAHVAHAGLLRAFGRAVTSRDWDPVVALCAPAFVEHDHRRLAVIGTTRGAAAWAQNFRTLVDLAPDTVYRIDHVRSGARGLWCVGTWHGTRAGGSYEIPISAVLEMDEYDRLARADIYDEDQLDQARARFAEIAGSSGQPFIPSGLPTNPLSLDTAPKERAYSARTDIIGPRIEGFANAATRAVDRGTAALAARDWEGFARLFAAGARHFDRTRLVQLESDTQEWLASFRQMVEMTSEPPVRTLLATRGERLALYRMLWQGAEGDIGPSEIDWLLIIEVDGRGDHLAVVVYDPDNLDAAYAELDARWAAGEAEAHPLASKLLVDYLRFFAARDWNAMATLFAPELVGENHRLVGWGTLHGPGAIVSTLQAQIELAPDTQERVDHVRSCAHAVLFEYAWHGTYAGGAFENLWIVLIELDDAGRGRRADVWEAEQLDQAMARFAEIEAHWQEGEASSLHASGRDRGKGPLAALVKPNLATASMERGWAAFDGFDPDATQGVPDAVRAQFTPDFVWEDRRPIVGLSGDLDLMIASMRERIASGARHERRTIVGTAGDRVAIARVLWAGGPPDGRFEVEFLVVHEVNEAGLCTGLIFFEVDDLRAAQREAWARWAAIEPVAAPWVELLTEIVDAWNEHDRTRLRARFADDLVVEDHRHAGLGRIEGAEAYVDSNVVLWELAPDQRLEIGWLWPAVDRHGLVVTQRRVGSLPDGGAFESAYIWLGLARGGRFTRLELFEMDALDTALARFEELRPDPLRIPPNAATRARAQWARAVGARDWEAVRGLVRADFVFEDRGKRALVTGDVETWIASAEFTTTLPGIRIKNPLIGTFGERISLDHLSWRGSLEGDAFEFERVRLLEIDEEGCFRTAILFDPDDRAAAFDEAHARFVASGAGASPEAFDLLRAWNAHDLARMRALLPDDFYLDDHRRTGVGRLDGADAYLASLAAMYQLSHDLRTETLYIVSVAAHGVVYVARWSGMNAEGGEFDAVYVCVGLQRGGRPAGLEIFEIDALDAALARFECHPARRQEQE